MPAVAHWVVRCTWDVDRPQFRMVQAGTKDLPTPLWHAECGEPCAWATNLTSPTLRNVRSLTSQAQRLL
jgi:hypothetical protein